MDISVSSVLTQSEDRSWLSSNFGCDEPRSITLDISAFTAGTHYPNGFLPAGLVIAKITATGLFGPYNDALSTGQEVAAGILFSSVKVPNPAVTTIDAGGAMLEMGLIIAAKLPAGNGLDAAARTDLVNWFKFL